MEQARRIPPCQTLGEVNHLMIEIAHEIKTITELLAALEQESAQLRAEVGQVETAAFLKAEGAMDLRKKIADQAAWDAGQAKVIAFDAALKRQRHRLVGLQVELDVVTKIGSNIKSEMRLV